jgi:hypothetical protein
LDEDRSFVLVYAFHGALQQDEDDVFDELLLRLLQEWIIVLHEEVVKVYTPFRVLVRFIIEAGIKFLSDSVIRTYLKKPYPFQLF